MVIEVGVWEILVSYILKDVYLLEQCLQIRLIGALVLGTSKADFFGLGLMEVSWNFLGFLWHKNKQKKSINHQICIKLVREVAFRII